MVNQFFTKTKKSLYLSSDQITSSLTKMYKLPPSFWKLSLSSQNNATKHNLCSIYTINQSVIATIIQVKSDLYEGKINNSRLYYESDLQVVDVIVNIYSQFSKKETNITMSDTNKLKEKILEQTNYLYSCIEHFPEDIATNIKARPSIISKVSLDYYQLIYLAFTHAQSQLNSIELVKSLSKLTEKSNALLN
ncbi:MAG: hypothetical protein ACJAZ2_000169 [Glaciecola sp.]|jgi:hypothetical protein